MEEIRELIRKFKDDQKIAIMNQEYDEAAKIRDKKNSLEEFLVILNNKEKARKYDDLANLIAECYDEESNADLVTIGELAAFHYGWV